VASYIINENTNYEITIESSSEGFRKVSDNLFYLNYNGNANRSDDYTFTFSDGASIRLTDFSEFRDFWASTSLTSVVGIPSSNSNPLINVNIGFGYLASVDIYDDITGVRLVDDWVPQSSRRNFEPIGKIQYNPSTNKLTLDKLIGNGSNRSGTNQGRIDSDGGFNIESSSYHSDEYDLEAPFRDNDPPTISITSSDITSGSINNESFCRFHLYIK